MSARQVNTTVYGEIAEQLAFIEANFGPKPPAIVRLALADFLPRYLTSKARPEHAELFAKLRAALDTHPQLADKVTRLIRDTHRQSTKAAA